ncbi:PLP-dependent transferase, partial [Oleiphilus sp. HI0128]
SGLASHPQADLVASQQTGNSGVLSFKIKGDKAAAWRFIDALEFVSITANLGDAKSTITHPATTTHGRLSQEDRDKSGISDNLIRISVGLESTDDLIADLSRGIAAIA